MPAKLRQNGGRAKEPSPDREFRDGIRRGRPGTKGGGQQPIHPNKSTAMRIQTLRIANVAIQTIAQALGISTETLYEHYAQDLDTAEARLLETAGLAIQRALRSSNHRLSFDAGRYVYDRRAPGWNEKIATDQKNDETFTVELIGEGPEGEAAQLELQNQIQTAGGQFRQPPTRTTKPAAPADPKPEHPKPVPSYVRPDWQPPGSTVKYTAAEVGALAPIRRTVEKQAQPEGGTKQKRPSLIERDVVRVRAFRARTPDADPD
jgi:hypothetical protein